MPDHVIENTPDGFRCIVCTSTWKTKPRSACPGVIRYQWLAAPEHLRTKSQLKKKKLNPGPVRGIVGDYYLFDVNEATPWTEEQRTVHRERNRQKCIHCGKMVSRGYWNAEFSACKKCLPAARQKHEEEIRLREEAMEREFQEMLVNARDEEITWSRDLLTRSDWVILDCETTGLDFGDEVISVAVIAPDGTELMNTLIMPANPIPPEATRINGITDEMVADVPTFPEIWAQLVEILEGRLVIAYNVDFDENMLAGTRSRYRDQIEWHWDEDRLGSKWQCAMLAYAAFVGQWHDYYKSFTWQPLPKGNHQASGDCQATLELIKRMAASKLSTEVEEVTNEP